MSAYFGRCNHNLTFTALHKLSGGKQKTSADWVVLGVKCKGRHFDVCAMLSDRDLVIVILPVSVAEHSGVNEVNDVHSSPIVLKHTIVKKEVFFTQVFAHHRQLFLAHHLAQVYANYLLVQAKGVAVKELGAFRCAPRSSVKASTIEDFAGFFTFLA